MIDFKAVITETANVDAQGYAYGSVNDIHIVSGSIEIDVLVNGNEYILYDNAGVKLLKFTASDLFHYTTSMENAKKINFEPAIGITFYSTENILFELILDYNTSFTFSTNATSGNYLVKNKNITGIYIPILPNESSLGLTNYYLFEVGGVNESYDITIKYFENDVVQYTHIIDGAIGYDDFIHSDFYLHNDGAGATLDTMNFHPIVFDFKNNDGMGNSDYQGVSLTLDGTTFDFNAVSSFRTLKSFIQTVSDKYSIIFEDLGGYPYYVLPSNLDSSVGGTDSGTGGSSGTTIDTSNINSILTEIDTQVTTSLNSAVADYFTNNPIDVSSISITSVVDDVTTSLNTFFDKGAYIDMTTTNSTLDNLVTTINSLKTAVNSIDTSSVSGTSTVDLSEVFTRFDNVDNAISSIPTTSVDFTDVLSRFNIVDTSLTALDTKLDNVSSTTVDCSSIDLSSMQTAIIDTISTNTHQFITNSSLNGSNGVIYEDGEVLNVEGYTRTYTVVSSQVITTMGNQADYIYLLKDSSDRFMITVQDMLSRPEIV